MLAADIVAFLHFLWITFIVTGAFLGRRYRWAKVFHIAGLSFAIVVWVFSLHCPLTNLEVWLRQMYDPLSAYSGSFIINYAKKLLHINLSPEIISVMTIAVFLMSVCVYLHKPKHN